MATMTSQILIGRPHPNDDGIIPTHYLFLSENSRPAWILVHQNINFSKNGHKKITWIPTLENMLEDAFLMVAIHVLENDKVLNLGKSFTSKIDSPRLELYSDLNEEQRNLLYAECKLINNFPKLIISTFKGSHIENTLSILKEYNMDIEVCTNSFSRLYSRWSGEVSTIGSLNE